MGSTVPSLDPGARQRLTARFGNQIAPWFDELPGVLNALAQRWQFQLGPPIPRGSMSVVLRCRMADGRGAVLKASPDRARLADEAAALEGWHTVHTPAVLALELYEYGRRLATRLAQDASPIVLLHGDLTPSNILDGGAERGLVAIDPAPCLGDPAFDAVDLICWQADDLETIEARIERLAAATGTHAERLLGWCTAFAGMIALELASQGNGACPATVALLGLAAQAPTD